MTLRYFLFLEVDIKVKIITVPDDQTTDQKEPQDVDTGDEGDTLSETMARAVSRLLDKILASEVMESDVEHPLAPILSTGHWNRILKPPIS